MHVFRDNANRLWTVSITVFTVKRCRALVNVDLYGLIDAGFEGLGKLLSDPVQLVDVLYVLCKDEADKLSVTDEDFGRAMAGDALGHAADAFIDELTDFFPDPKGREALRTLTEKGKKVAALMLDDALKKLDALDPASVLPTSNGQSINSPASSESTPETSHSEN